MLLKVPPARKSVVGRGLCKPSSMSVGATTAFFLSAVIMRSQGLELCEVLLLVWLPTTESHDN